MANCGIFKSLWHKELEMPCSSANYITTIKKCQNSIVFEYRGLMSEQYGKLHMRVPLYLIQLITTATTILPLLFRGLSLIGKNQCCHLLETPRQLFFIYKDTYNLRANKKILGTHAPSASVRGKPHMPKFTSPCVWLNPYMENVNMNRHLPLWLWLGLLSGLELGLELRLGILLGSWDVKWQNQ